MKPATTIEQQIDILKRRGLIIEDEAFAKYFLSRNCYYRFTGYAKIFMINDQFYAGTTFEDIYQIYCFDSELRGLLNIFLARVEILIRSKMINHLAICDGPLGYKKEDIYRNKSAEIKTLENITNEVAKASRTQREEFLHHFKEDEIPYWALIEILSFGNISKFYSSLKTNKQKDISREFKNLSYTNIAPNMMCLVNLRNMCAHRSRVYRTYLPSNSPRLTRKTEEILKEIDPVYFVEVKYERTLFARLCALVELLNDKDEANEFIDRLIKLFDRYKDHIKPEKHLLFPSDWIDILRKINIEIN